MAWGSYRWGYWGREGVQGVEPVRQGWAIAVHYGLRSTGLAGRYQRNMQGRMMDSEALAVAISEWRERQATMREEDDARLWRKLRLEWNYNSNHIEGNTLSYHETELLLIFGRTSGGHPMRHYEEMKAHDVAIKHTRQLASTERVLGEGDIRDLNKILLKEPFWHIAETPDGQQTRKRIVPGEYKTQPNHVRTATGELHRFAEAEETPALMQAWISDFRRDLGDSERSASRLSLFLAESHWSFLRIHPFDDGNGRTVRLLTNYCLLRSDLPPIVIKSADRDRYIGALQNADRGRIEPLVRFMLDNMMWALEVGILAARGKPVREAGDSRKRVELFARKYDVRASLKGDVERLDKVFHLWIRPILEEVEEGLEPLQRLFARTYWGSHVRIGEAQPIFPAGNVFTEKHWGQTKQSHIVLPGFRLSNDRILELRVELTLTAFAGRGSAFSMQLRMTWMLGGEDVEFATDIDGGSIGGCDRRVLYSELDVPDPAGDPSAVVICQAVMDEIDRRSRA